MNDYLDLSAFPSDTQAELSTELEGAEVVVTGTTIRAYRDGVEVNAHLDMIGSVIRAMNPLGVYKVGKLEEVESAKAEAALLAHNPFKVGTSFNLTEQGRLYRDNPVLAQKLQEAAR